MKIAVVASDEKKDKIIIEKIPLDKEFGRMTISQAGEYVDQQINDLAAVKTVLKWLVMSVLLLRRRK
ncbi:MAG: hypothetical protein ACOY4W_16710 [Thermodesulfobacteriota bacterium]